MKFYVLATKKQTEYNKPFILGITRGYNMSPYKDPEKQREACKLNMRKIRKNRAEENEQ